MADKPYTSRSDILRSAKEYQDQVLKLLIEQRVTLVPQRHGSPTVRGVGDVEHVLEEVPRVLLVLCILMDPSDKIFTELAFSVDEPHRMDEENVPMLRIYRNARTGSIHFRLRQELLSPIMQDLAERYRLLEKDGPRLKTDHTRREHHLLSAEGAQQIIEEIAEIAHHAHPEKTPPPKK